MSTETLPQSVTSSHRWDSGDGNLGVCLQQCLGDGLKVCRKVERGERPGLHRQCWGAGCGVGLA